MPWFPQHEAEKVRGQSTSTEGSAFLHQAADKSYVCGQLLRWAEGGLCTTEDSQWASGFGGQVGNVAFPGKIMADSETQKLERKDFFQWIVEKVDGEVFQMVLSERQSESVRFVRIERHVPRVGPVCDFPQIFRERRSCSLPV